MADEDSKVRSVVDLMQIAGRDEALDWLAVASIVNMC